MSALSSAFGLQPIGSGVGTIPDADVWWFPLGADNTTAIFWGDPVNITSGVVTAIGATPTTTLGANTPFGVMVGCEYDAPDVRGRVLDSYLPASALTGKLLTNVRVAIWFSRTPFKVQADGAVAATAIGKNAPLGNFGAGSTTAKISRVKLLSGSIAATSTLAVKIIGIDQLIGNAAGDAFTIVNCVWNAGVHAFGQATGQ